MLGLIADDLTGACDSAAPFLGGGRVLVSIWPALPAAQRAACLAVSTETRDGDPEPARSRSAEAVRRLRAAGSGRLFRKVDSRLRGHIRAEIAGALDAWAGGCLLAPALPAEGRLTRGGRQLVDGEAIDIAALVAGLEPRVEVRDAETDAELAVIAAELAARPDLMAAGSAGLAAALAAALGLAGPGPGWPARRRPLALVGSKTAVSAQQMEAARAAGWEVRRRARDGAVDLAGHDALFLSGGGTAAGVVTALGASTLELVGELLPRVPVGRLLDGPHAGLVVALKSGGFGGPGAIAAALARLSAGG